MEKHTITKIDRYTTNKDGQPLTFKGKDGTQVPYTRILLKTDLGGDKNLSAFGNKFNADWKIGDVIEGKIVETAKDGKTYYNFETPKKEDLNAHKLEEILNGQTTIKLRLDSILKILQANQPIPKGTKVGNTDIEYPTNEPDPLDIPF